MSPKPIQSVGRVRPEAVVVPDRERDSLAYQMSIEGVTSTAEYIAMIDAKVAAGEMHDGLADAIRAEIGRIVGGQEPYDFASFTAAVAAAASSVVGDAGFRSSFDFNKVRFDSFVQEADKYRKQGEGKQPAELSAEEQNTLQSTVAQMVRDQLADRNAVLLDEVDRVMIVVRQNLVRELGIDDREPTMGQMVPGVEPLEVSSDDDFVESPGDFHVNMEELGRALDPSSKPQ